MSEELNYATLYVQKQEQHIIELTRKMVDIEVKNSVLATQLKQIESQFEESQKQVEIQNKLMDQAAESVKNLTVTRDDLNLQIKDLEGELTGCKKRIDILTEKNNELAVENEQVKARLNTYMREVERQKGKLTEYHVENQRLKEETDELDNSF